VTRGWLPQRTGSPIPVGAGDAAVVPPITILTATYDEAGVANSTALIAFLIGASILPGHTMH